MSDIFEIIIIVFMSNSTNSTHNDALQRLQDLVALRPHYRQQVEEVLNINHTIFKVETPG